ncbi:hypothetical protein CDO52_00790 [Nocardiopsis gilva YIM 90087]|uniref:Uncharacterized protein n=1 Tax=Nocardiopsis gilva YIM 90087 TaxID=1235441 RepID=A0A223S062_9ACTN|nr:hypothetical protein [Nocardiopsis gilva]ASU81515.1 hypothetical protein CDO52_00790 [Nocardiopsis gilva YIM 90087]
MYTLWDADRGEVLSSGHTTPDTAIALMKRLLVDAARHAPGQGDIILCLEVRDADTDQVIATG